MENSKEKKSKSNSEISLHIQNLPKRSYESNASYQIEEEKNERSNTAESPQNESNKFNIQEPSSPQFQKPNSKNDGFYDPLKKKRSNSKRQKDKQLIPNMEYNKESESSNIEDTIVVGICAREKKTICKPMRNIIKHLQYFKQFDLKIFTDDTILRQDITTWPVVDVLIAFYSDGFPLEKAQAYCKSTNPFLINNIFKQDQLLDRGIFYQIMKDHGIPVPDFYISDPNQIVEDENFILINGQKLIKPFVEKPTDAERHDVYIYYHSEQGGGRTELFRKIDNRSSQFSTDSAIRRDSMYLYEKFLPTQGFDIKIYTVGAEYAHAETRKAPHLDGKVERTADGKEFRMPINLTVEEKLISKKIVEVFGQNVCGFDILRANGKSYVCDING